MNKETSEKTSSPSSMPESAPTNYGGGRYSDFTLSTVIEMQRTLGKVEQAIEDLSKQITTQSAKLDNIDRTVHTGRGILIAAGVVLGALGGISVFLLNKIWDVVAALLHVSPHP